MKNLFEEIAIIFSVYTKIPMPAFEWNDRNLKHAMCFLPLVGLFIGFAEMLWFLLSAVMNLSAFLFAVTAALLPLAITGGIHMDGFLDTVDARCSHESREKKQLILEDPHVGAFGVIWSAAYLLMLAGTMFELYRTAGERVDFHLQGAMAVVFVASRALAALSIGMIRPARQKGMLFSFASVTDKKALCMSSAGVLLVCAAALCFMCGPWGLLFLPVMIAVYWSFRRRAIREFGGLSGDLCGWLIQRTELILLLLLIVICRLAG